MTTIHDIATNLGITAATVSRSVNEKPGVGAAPRETIREEAARLNFVAYGAAQPVRSARTKTAAMTVARLTSTDTLASEPVYGPIMLGIEQELEQYGYHVLISTLTDAHPRQPERWSILHGRVDAVIVVGLSAPVRFLRPLGKRGMAAVPRFDDPAPVARINPPLTTVRIPTEEVGRGAATLLLRCIAHPDTPRPRSLVATSLAVRRSCGCEEKPDRSYVAPEADP